MDRTGTSRQQRARLRDEVLDRRDALKAMQRIEFSLKAAEIVAAHLKIEPGMVVSGFFPIRSEIDARPLMEIVRQRGARLCLPVVLDKTTIVFRELVRGAELVPTGFGTSGPGEDAPALDPQLLIMPLSVFDRTGGRIGYGAGHYDRAIARLLAKGMTPRLEGLAFSCQEVEAVPVEDHDQPLNAIITEREYVVTGR